MNETIPCPQCGKPIAPKALMGLCPECLLKAGFGTADGAQPSAFDAPNLAPTPEELAARFPQLEIIELLGRGGMGAVYKARQKQLDRLVALKILPPAVSHDPSFAARFTREARALAKLQHPNIVTLYEFGEAQGQYYFLMEYVDGLNLRQILNAGSMAPKEALAIVPQICDALQAAHDQGIVHRDIKPENILLNKAGQVKIADFGVAKIVAGESLDTGAVSNADLNSQTEAGKVVGTRQYMAPEQIAAPREVDHRADIYALGVVFYQMLTGEMPIGKFEKPSQRVRVDVRLDEVVLRAMEKEPSRRFQSVSAMKTAVETIATRPQPMTNPARKERTWLWAALAICAILLLPLLGLIGLGVLFFYWSLAAPQRPPAPRIVVAERIAETPPPIATPEMRAIPDRTTSLRDEPAILAELKLVTVPPEFKATPESLTAENLNTLPDIRQLSAPALLMHSGTSGKIEIGALPPDGSANPFGVPLDGLVIDVTPQLRGDVVSSKLVVRDFISANAEHSRTIYATVLTISKLGETFVFELGPTDPHHLLVGSIRFTRHPAGSLDARPILPPVEKAAATPREVVAAYLQAIKEGRNQDAFDQTVRNNHVSWGSDLTKLLQTDSFGLLHQLGTSDSVMVFSNPVIDPREANHEPYSWAFEAQLLKRDGRWLIESSNFTHENIAADHADGFKRNAHVRYDVLPAELAGGWSVNTCGGSMFLNADGTGTLRTSNPGGENGPAVDFRWSVKGDQLTLPWPGEPDTGTISWIKDRDARVDYDDDHGLYLVRYNSDKRFGIYASAEENAPRTWRGTLRNGKTWDHITLQNDPLFDENALTKAELSHDPSAHPLIHLALNAEAAKKLGDVTAKNIGKRLGVTLNGQLIMAPVIQSAITAGELQLTGNFTESEAADFVKCVNTVRP